MGSRDGHADRELCGIPGEISRSSFFRGAERLALSARNAWQKLGKIAAWGAGGWRSQFRWGILVVELFTVELPIKL